LKNQIRKTIRSIRNRLIFKILDFLDIIKLNNILYKYSIARKKLNSHILDDGNSSFSLPYYFFHQHIPDRYTYNFHQYKKLTDFLSFQDLKAWTKDNYKNNVSDISRFFFLNLCIDYLLEEGIEGDVAELGVYKGNSAFLLSKYAQRVNSTCYLFDTFEGFDSNDLSGLAAVENKFMDTSLEYVKETVGEKNTIYVKGYFPDSLEQIDEIDSFCLVHLDCDLGKPFIASLDYFYPKIKRGGFLIMHDHSSLHWVGAKKAIDDFFRNKKEYIIPIPDKSGTCVIRKQ
jgi:hypothetical protein